jgi:hypothetical protein
VCKNNWKLDVGSLEISSNLFVSSILAFLIEIQQEDPSENYPPTLGWSLRLYLGGSLFLDDEKILFIDDVYL